MALCVFTLAEVNYPHLSPQSQLAIFAMFGLVLCFLNRPLHAKLVKMPQRVIVGSEKFDSVVEAEADRLDEIIAAFDEALGKVLKRLVEWTLITGDRVHRQRRGRSS